MKKTVIAVDGGGNKTLCILVDEEGIVLAKSETGCSNHQLCGIKQASDTICDAIDELLSKNGDNKVAATVLGLAGMDFDSDVTLMTNHLSETTSKLSPLILNDAWIALAAGGIEDGYGAVSICGTGHNTGVLAKDGTRYGISALRYCLGNFGGGLFLAEHALHKAFRSYEKTGEYTALEAHLPELCDAKNMEDLLFKIYESNYTYHRPFGIPKLVDTLALQGDKPCRQLLTTFGKTQGEMTGRLIKEAGLQNDITPVVLAGSVYTKRQTDYITDAFKAEVQKYCQGAVLNPLSRQPVLGAAMLGLRQIHKDISKEDAAKLMQNMEVSMCSKG